jgi:hypothetical protein
VASLLEIVKARSILQRPGAHKSEDNQLFFGLFPLLESLRSRQATDPGDKVYARPNVANAAKDSDLKADYRKSPTEVYAMTAKWLLQRQKSLAFLSLVEKKDKPDLISWVLDFRYKDYMNFLHQPTQVFRGNNHIYYASGRKRNQSISSRCVEYTFGQLSRGLIHQATLQTMGPAAHESSSADSGINLHKLALLMAYTLPLMSQST